MFFLPPQKINRVSLTFLLSLLMGGCTGAQIANRTETADHIAQAGNLFPLTLATPPYVLTGWGRVTKGEEPTHLYIEGDGLAWLGRRVPAPNPTPKNPYGLRLAAVDPSPNVIYLARPCQFTDPATPGHHCTITDWTDGRFNQSIITAYTQALDLIRHRYAVTRFELIGYSGGANIAGLLAATRPDVINWRSVAGNLDNRLFTELHAVSPMPAAVVVTDQASRLTHIPQIHFIAEQDAQVPAALADSYRHQLDHPNCIQIKTIPDTTHDQGWVAAWPNLLTHRPVCQGR